MGTIASMRTRSNPSAVRRPNIRPLAKGRPNPTEAIINMLADAISARRDAAQAQSRVTALQGQVDAQQKKQAALAKAAEAFNGTVASLRGQLTEAESDSCTLAHREKVAGELNSELETAQRQMANLDPSVQIPAQVVLDQLTGRARAVQTRAANEKQQVDGLDTQIQADTKALIAAAGNTKHMDALGNELKALYAKYKDPSELVKGLPSDAKDAMNRKIGALNDQVYRDIVWFSGHYEVDAPDNSYMFGRPGPKMHKAYDTINTFLASAPGPVSSDQRAAVISALNDMHKALGDFQDPMTLDAAQHVYDELSAQALAKLTQS